MALIKTVHVCLSDLSRRRMLRAIIYSLFYGIISSVQLNFLCVLLNLIIPFTKILYSIKQVRFIICCALTSAVSCPWGPGELLALKTAHPLGRNNLGVKCRRPAGWEGCGGERGADREENGVKLNHQETSGVFCCFFLFYASIFSSAKWN